MASSSVDCDRCGKPIRSRKQLLIFLDTRNPHFPNPRKFIALHSKCDVASKTMRDKYFFDVIQNRFRLSSKSIESWQFRIYSLLASILPPCALATYRNTNIFSYVTITSTLYLGWFAYTQIMYFRYRKLVEQ